MMKDLRTQVDAKLTTLGYHANPFSADTEHYLGSWREWYERAIHHQLLTPADLEQIRRLFGDDRWFHAFND